jgi:hypothetical protein
LAVVVLGAAVGAFFWIDGPVKENWFLSALKSKIETLPAAQDDTKQIIITLLAGQQRDRQMLMQDLSELAARVDHIERALDKLKTANAETASSSNKDSAGAEARSPTAEPKPPLSEERPVRRGDSRASAPDNQAAAKQPDGGPSVTGSLPVEPGAMQNPSSRAELDARKPPLGCTQFRSYDPVSGTYTTLEGRRRPCR